MQKSIILLLNITIGRSTIAITHAVSSSSRLLAVRADYWWIRGLSEKPTHNLVKILQNVQWSWKGSIDVKDDYLNKIIRSLALFHPALL